MPESEARKVVVVTGASSGFGALAVRALGRSGHTVYAGIRDTAGRNAAAVADLEFDARQDRLDLRSVELDVSDESSVNSAIDKIVTKQGRLDVVVHNAGHLVLGPAEAFTPEQIASVYDTNVIGAQRVNRAALPHMRKQRSGLLVWVSSSSTQGGCPPFLTPYFAAKAAMDAFAVHYAGELIRHGIDTAIVVPGAFTSGTNHFAHAGSPQDSARAAEYDELYGELQRELPGRLASLIPPDGDVAEVAAAIADIVDLPQGKRPFRTHIDPTRDGSEVVSAVHDRIRVEFFRRAGLTDLLTEFASL
jgi:NAD(P)-dependent dehydrogenase (short-subunit alcohol dehydrogenase family)